MNSYLSQRATAVKACAYDGQDFWLYQKRLSELKFRWRQSGGNEGTKTLAADELQVLLSTGNRNSTKALLEWRPVSLRRRKIYGSINL